MGTQLDNPEASFLHHLAQCVGAEGDEVRYFEAIMGVQVGHFK